MEHFEHTLGWGLRERCTWQTAASMNLINQFRVAKRSFSDISQKFLDVNIIIVKPKWCGTEDRVSKVPQRKYRPIMARIKIDFITDTLWKRILECQKSFVTFNEIYCLIPDEIDPLEHRKYCQLKINGARIRAERYWRLQRDMISPISRVHRPFRGFVLINIDYAPPLSTAHPLLLLHESAPINCYWIITGYCLIPSAIRSRYAGFRQCGLFADICLPSPTNPESIRWQPSRTHGRHRQIDNGDLTFARRSGWAEISRDHTNLLILLREIFVTSFVLIRIFWLLTILLVIT
jgi:hypothetical protein